MPVGLYPLGKPQKYQDGYSAATNTYTSTLLQPGSSSPMVLGSFSACRGQAIVSHEPGCGLFVIKKHLPSHENHMTMKLSMLIGNQTITGIFSAD